MQFKKTTLSWLILIFPLFIFSQSVTLPQDAKENWLVTRMDIKLAHDSLLQFTAAKPWLRKNITEGIERVYRGLYVDQSSVALTSPPDPPRTDWPLTSGLFSRVDIYNMNDALLNNSEWVAGNQSSFASKKPLFGVFYKTKADFLQVNQKDFFLAVNPVIQQLQSAESGNSGERIFLNSKGVRFRGMIAKKIGFDFYATDNQERPPLFVQQFEKKFNAVPGAGFYKPFKTTAYDYFDGRGSVYVNATKYVNVQFGYDRNFIGDGYRSLLLSDFSASYLFLKLYNHIWKLQYQILFMELYS